MTTLLALLLSLLSLLTTPFVVYFARFVREERRWRASIALLDRNARLAREYCDDAALVEVVGGERRAAPRPPRGLNSNRDAEVAGIEDIARTMNLDTMTAQAIWLAQRPVSN